MQLVFCCVPSFLSWPFNLVITSLRAEFQVYSLSPGFFVRRPRQNDMICWEFDVFSQFSVSS